jgi:colicin import membrane protein
MREQAEREARTREEAQAKARAAAELRARQQAEADARAKAEADWIRAIQGKVRGNVILPPDMPGNPEAVFEVVQLPTGEILDVQLRRSSGVRAYDEAVQRAIHKSSPLPRPPRPEMFQRTLLLRFRPME